MALPWWRPRCASWPCARALPPARSRLIASSAHSVEAGTTLVNGAGHTMGHIVESIRNVAGMISDISAATHSQTRDIHDINTAVARLDEMTQQNSALVEESAAASEGLRHRANDLTHLISQFVLPVEQGQSIGHPRSCCGTRRNVKQRPWD